MTKVQILKTKDQLKISALKKNEVHHFHIHASTNAMGLPWRVPVIVARGEKEGPVLGITAALHGNELNGLSTIFKLFRKIDLSKLSGSIVAIPVVNVPGYLNKIRYFTDGTDLNRVMPGNPKGKPADVYCHFLTDKIIKHFDYLLDLHTASFGKINSLYIRADLDNPITKKMAFLQNPHIIVQKYDEQGTLRAWANSNNIPCITIEIGNPNTFQHNLIDDTLDGLINTLKGLKMLSGKVKNYMDNTVVCDSSFWVYSEVGGIVDVLPTLGKMVKKDELIAVVYNVFGEVKNQVFAKEEGIVIGRSVSPCCDSGDRLVHLGRVNYDIQDTVTSI